MYKLYLQYWEESEQGWGQRPDGCSLHVTENDLNDYIKEYWEGMPKEVPAEYSRPLGKSKVVDVTQELFDQVKNSRIGLRFFSNVSGILK